jgi:hypothetical protein
MNSLEIQVTKFSSITNAKSFANRCNKIHLIVLGDDKKFWVAPPRVTEQLVKSGYEYAK